MCIAVTATANLAFCRDLSSSFPILVVKNLQLRQRVFFRASFTSIQTNRTVRTDKNIVAAAAAVAFALCDVMRDVIRWTVSKMPRLYSVDVNSRRRPRAYISCALSETS